MLLKERIKSLFLICFLFLTPIIHSVDEKNIAKVICSLNQFKEIDVLKGIFGDSVKLSKSLNKECSMKLRFITSSVTEIGRKGFVSFANDELENKKETL